MVWKESLSIFHEQINSIREEAKNRQKHGLVWLCQINHLKRSEIFENLLDNFQLFFGGGDNIVVGKAELLSH